MKSIEKRKAVTVVVAKEGWLLGLAEENVSGYSPLNYGPFETDVEAQKLADIMNEKFGLSKRMALLIALSSMFPMNDVAHARRVKNWEKIEAAKPAEDGRG